ncbi:MAG: NAD(P)H-dependent glycerol-3-phosphate dehydrogenase, partial [Chloroflexota bacterium]|nr:NAD(P)H-dependent glycerol-3-phosphate dehydrogenase [Chloroflexota bacterium]
MPNVAVVGSGSWGTALAVVCARKGAHVKLWTRTSNEAKKLGKARENTTFLHDVQFPRRLAVTASMEETLEKADVLVIAVPSQSMRQNVHQIKEYLGRSTVVVSATKGLELQTGKRMSQVIKEELDGLLEGGLAVLSGPNIAMEAAQGMHSVTVIASDDINVAEKARRLLLAKSFCINTTTDVVGVEIAGSLKNIVALGTGVADGLGYGDNAKAAFITRGLGEISALGIAMKADPQTFFGLAGMGDIIVTCSSPLSRNRYVGTELGRGRSLKDITTSMPHTAEGITTSLAALGLGKKYDVEMPVAD